MPQSVWPCPHALCLKCVSSGITEDWTGLTETTTNTHEAFEDDAKRRIGPIT